MLSELAVRGISLRGLAGMMGFANLVIIKKTKDNSTTAEAQKIVFVALQNSYYDNSRADGARAPFLQGVYCL